MTISRRTLFLFSTSTACVVVGLAACRTGPPIKPICDPGDYSGVTISGLDVSTDGRYAFVPALWQYAVSDCGPVYVAAGLHVIDLAATVAPATTLDFPWSPNSQTVAGTELIAATTTIRAVYVDTVFPLSLSTSDFPDDGVEAVSMAQQAFFRLPLEDEILVHRSGEANSVIPLPERPVSMVPAWGRLYVAMQTGGIAVIDPLSRTLTGILPSCAPPLGSQGFAGFGPMAPIAPRYLALLCGSSEVLSVDVTDGSSIPWMADPPNPDPHLITGLSGSTSSTIGLVSVTTGYDQTPYLHRFVVGTGAIDANAQAGNAGGRMIVVDAGRKAFTFVDGVGVIVDLTDVTRPLGGVDGGAALMIRPRDEGPILAIGGVPIAQAGNPVEGVALFRIDTASGAALGPPAVFPTPPSLGPHSP